MDVPDVINSYFEADARRDTDAIVALFTEDAVLVDEGETWHGSSAIRAWREGTASRYEYTTQVFTDLVMPSGPDGVEVLKAAKKFHPSSYVVVMTGYSSIETAIESIRCGAFDYLTKPFKLAQIDIIVDRILEYLAMLDDNKRLSAKLAVVTEKSTTIDSRLERIEVLLSSLIAKVPT